MEALDLPVSNGLDWWPMDYVEIDVSTVPLKTAAANTWGASNTIRLGQGNWIGITGFYNGARISQTPRSNASSGNPISYPIAAGAVFPRPVRGDGTVSDIFVVRETGAGGLMMVASFLTRDAAELWCRHFVPPQSGALSPFSNPHTTSADGQSPPLTSDVWSWPLVWNGATATWDRYRQPDSRKPIVTIAAAVSVTSTGVKATYTATNKGLLLGVYMAASTSFGSGGQMSAEIVSGGTTLSLGNAEAAAAWSAAAPAPVADLMAALITPTAPGGAAGTLVGVPMVRPYPYLGADVVNARVNIAPASGAANFWIVCLEDRFNFG